MRITVAALVSSSRSSQASQLNWLSVLPQRFTVERFFVRVCHNRRPAKEFEATIKPDYAASVVLLARASWRI